MATGSGKTLVIVKLVEILHELIKRGEIPNHDILILAHRDDLLDQLQDHIDNYNTSGNLHIQLHELRDYSEVKRSGPNLFAENERTVFFYRSDNLSDEQKEKIIDFRNYDNHGNWYILLDEAHKGDREDSKRQQIYNILARNGFLFNFSATFTDAREIITTAFNFNLSEFIRKGYGKHIYVFGQETRAFRNKEDFTEGEKQKIVLKALILLTHIQQQAGKVQSIDPGLFHRPLLMALVNSVNTKDADLKLLFRELARIAKSDIDEQQWVEAKRELLAELSQNPSYVYEQGSSIRLDTESIESIKISDMLSAVFNTDQPGQIEILFRPSDRKEIAFKLKTSDEPFALIRIGDISDWIVKELQDYEVNHRFDDEGYFDRLNKNESTINLLLGSRSFYEGWDSNRPNVIMYINIGTGTDAKKFILQSVGRGARIEPLEGYRKRFDALLVSGVLSDKENELFQEVHNDILPLESEFIFGTNRSALETVIGELDQEDILPNYHEISLKKNLCQIDGKTLLIPVFKEQDRNLYHQRGQAKFSLSSRNLEQLDAYLDYVNDDRVLLALYNVTPKQIENIRASINKPQEHFRTDGPNYKNISVLFSQVIRFTSLRAQEFEKFKLLEEEISHYQHVRVMLPDLEFERFEKQLSDYYTKPAKISELKAQYQAEQLDLDLFSEKLLLLNNSGKYTYQGKTVTFKEIKKHYYLPILISSDDTLEYLRSVIKVPSEVRFLNKLEDELRKSGNEFEKYDWWLFSRIDENWDQIYIPYYHPIENRMAKFKPDFIFWLKKGHEYQVLFVDPKGTSLSEYQFKVDGFRRLFEINGESIKFSHNDLEIVVRLALFTVDRGWSADFYKKYWFDNIGQMLN